MNTHRVYVSVEDFDEAAETFDEGFRVQRARSVAASIARQASLGATTSALDFGCGTGLLGFELLPRVGSMVFADPSPGMLEEVRNKIQPDDASRISTLLLDPDAHVLPQTFDLIVTLMTLHHIQDAEAAFHMLARHLKPGGTLALADLDSEDGSFHGAGADVHQGFERAIIREWMVVDGLRDLQESTPWTMRKEIYGETHEYPVFLITGQRP